MRLLRRGPDTCTARKEAAKLSLHREIWEAGEFNAFCERAPPTRSLPAILEYLMSSRDRERRRPLKTSIARQQDNQASLYLLHFPPEGESREYRQEQRFARDLDPKSRVLLSRALRHFCSDARAQIADGTSVDTACDRYQHRSASTRPGVCLAGQSGNTKWMRRWLTHSSYANADNWGLSGHRRCGPNATTLH